MSFLRGFSIAVMANAILFIFSFLNNKLLYIELSRENNGLFFLVMRYSLLFSLLLNEWIRITNINIAGKNKSLTPFLASNNIYYALLVSLFLIFFFFFSPSAISLMMPGLPLAYILPVAVIGLSLMVRDSFQSLLLVNNHLKIYGVTTVLWGIIFLGLNIVFILVLHLGLKYVVAALFIASFISALWAISGIAILNGISFVPSFNTLKKSAKLGLKASIAVLGMFLMINIHTFSIEPMSNAESGLLTVGIFSVGFRIFQLFQRGSDVTSSILFSNIAQSSESSGKWMSLLVFRNIFLLTIVFSIIVGILGKFIILIIADNSYFDAYLTLIFMIPGIIFINSGSVLNSYYWARGYPLRIILAPFGASIAGIILDFFLIPVKGAEGASIAFSVTSFFWFIYILIIFKNDSGQKLLYVLFPVKEDYYYLINKFKARLIK